MALVCTHSFVYTDQILPPPPAARLSTPGFVYKQNKDDVRQMLTRHVAKDVSSILTRGRPPSSPSQWEQGAEFIQSSSY